MKKSGKKSKPGNQREAVELKNMCRLKLGKTNTEFFSEKGNNMLKRIWLSNNLDEEMIFSSWIGPSKALLRHKVSDYIQAFIIRRSMIMPFQNYEMVPKLRRLGKHFDMCQSDKGKYDYFDSYIKTKSKTNEASRENNEKLRMAKSIVNGDLPNIPGFEYVMEHPVFKAQEVELRMQNLSKIPLPYDEIAFEKYVLPMLTSLAIFKEQNNSTKKVSSLGKVYSERMGSIESESKQTSSGFTDDSIVTLQSKDEDMLITDSDLIQVLSELHLSSMIDTQIDLDETLNDVCETCGGLLNNEDVNDGLECTCIPDQVWEGRRHSRATSLYEEASKIVEMYLREKMVSAEYMEQFSFKTWLK